MLKREAMSKIRVRFAPSPTGQLHVGNARTALFNWLFARHHSGAFVLRIEDTDKAREVEGSAAHIMECLHWLSIEWDEGPDKGGPHAPYLQSERLETYRAYAARLIAAGYADPDPYSEAELEAFRSHAEGEKRPFLFREHRPAASIAWDGSQPLRFRVPALKRYVWQDAVRGELSAGEEALDDFILIKGDGYPTYNFAHVVDDIEMQITHVMRGEDHVSTTPKQIAVYRALGAATPLGRVSDVLPNDPEFGQSEDEIARHWCAVAGLAYLGRADIGHDPANKVVPFGRFTRKEMLP